MQISFDMLSLSCPRESPKATVETDQYGEPERIGDSEWSVAVTKILFGGDGSRSAGMSGGGPLENPIVLLGTSVRKELVTASAKLTGGAVSLPCAFIPSILSGLGDPFGRLKLNSGVAHPPWSGLLSKSFTPGT
jgi:hypothetical protein